MVVSFSALLIFAGVYLVAVATPGPGIAALVARVLGCGLKGVAPFIAGFAVGDLFWLAVAATGLAVVAHEFATLFVALKFAGAAYLLYVAWGLVRAPAAVDLEAPPDRVATGWRAFLGGFSITLGNPKVIVFFLSIMPLVVDLDAVDAVSFAKMAANLRGSHHRDARRLRAGRKSRSPLVSFEPGDDGRSPRDRRRDGGRSRRDRDALSPAVDAVADRVGSGG